MLFDRKKHNGLDFNKIYKEGIGAIEKIPIIKERKKTKFFFRIIKNITYLLIILFVIAGIIISLTFFKVKKIYSEIIAGKNNLTLAVSLVSAQDFKNSIDYSSLAQENFTKTFVYYKELKNDYYIIYNLPFLKKQFDNIEYIISAANLLSKALNRGSNFAYELKNLSEGNKGLAYSELSQSEKEKILKKIYFSSPELVGIKSNLELALLNLNQINYNGALIFFSDRIDELKNNINIGVNSLDKAIPLSQILPSVSGYPKKAVYLVLFENSDELRPTGGFLGNYGILEVNNGDIISFNTHDTYHMDMPVKDKLNIEPPLPLQKYMGLKKWYLRDSNWSPDWALSAKNIETFYKKENDLLIGKNKINNYNGKFDGIIAITPKFITSLINITGPISIEGKTYDKNNFTELLEYRVEKEYAKLGISSWNRKDVIGDIAKEIKIKLLDLPSTRWIEIIKTFDENILKKNILIYFNNNDMQSLGQELGWTGEVKKTEGDYLFVVDANMASLKTDSVMTRGIDYKIIQSKDKLTAKLYLNYAHNGGVDWRTSTYQSYTRVYVPDGAKLIKSEGFASNEYFTGKESGKTYFAGLVSIKPGQIGRIYLEYSLPKNINNFINKGNYSLYLQKQPGNEISELNIDLSFNNNIKSYNPSGFSSEKRGNKIKWKTDLSTDRVFQVNLENN